MTAAVAARKTVPLDKMANGVLVHVAGEDVYVGPLSIDQWCEVSRVALQAVARFPEGTIERIEKLSKGKDITSIITAFVSIIDGDTVRGLLSAITGLDAEKVESARMPEFLNVIDVVKQSGELKEIVACFSRVVEGW